MEQRKSKQGPKMDKVQEAVEAGRMGAYAAAKEFDVTTAAIYKAKWYRAMKAKEVEAVASKQGGSDGVR